MHRRHHTHLSGSRRTTGCRSSVAPAIGRGAKRFERSGHFSFFAIRISSHVFNAAQPWQVVACALIRSSKPVRRSADSSGVDVRTTIPSFGRIEQLSTGPVRPSTSTKHSRQLPSGNSSRMAQRFGMAMPASSAAHRSGCPVSAGTSRPSMRIVTRAIRSDLPHARRAGDGGSDRTPDDDDDHDHADRKRCRNVPGGCPARRGNR